MWVLLVLGIVVVADVNVFAITFDVSGVIDVPVLVALDVIVGI